MSLPLDPEPKVCLPFSPCSEEDKKHTEQWKDELRDKVLPDAIDHPLDSTMDSIGRAFQDAVAWFFRETSAWWVGIDSPDLENTGAITALHGLFQPITVAVAMTALLVAAGKMALTRKANPLLDVGTGLILVAAVSAIGVTLPNLLLQWTDAWSAWALSESTGDAFAKRMVELVTTDTGVPGVVAFLLGLIALVIGVAQAILLLFRQATVIILAGALPLAAAGTLTSATKDWFKKISGWGLAVIFYKPCGAAVYATAFTLIGAGDNLQTTFMGFAMMVISLTAFPVLLKFFTWTTGGSQSSGGGSFLGSIVGGATALGAVRGFGPVGAAAAAGRAAGEHADFLSQQLDNGRPPSGSGGLSKTPQGGGPSSTGSSSSSISATRSSTSNDDRSSAETSADDGRADNPSGSAATQSGDGGFGGRPVPRHQRPSRPPIVWMNRPPDDDLPTGGVNV